MTRTVLAMLAAITMTAASGCGDDDPGDMNGDASTDTDGDTDTDTDTEADTDADAGPLCSDPIELMQPAPDGGPDIPLGITLCADEARHRHTAVACTTTGWEATLCAECGECPEGELCTTNESTCMCTTPCASDGDCAEDEICLCEEAGTWATHCVPANCHTDADCGGLECGLDGDACGSWTTGAACRTGTDECHGTAQCPEGEFCIVGQDSPDADPCWGCDSASACD